MEKKLTKINLDDKIIIAQERLEKLKKEKERKISRIILKTFFFLRTEIDILNFLNEKATDKDFLDMLKIHFLDYEEFKSISRLAKSDDLISQEGDLNRSAE